MGLFSVVRRAVLLVPLAALLLGAVSTTVSHAASYFPLLGDRNVFGSHTQYAAVDEASFSMAPGEIRRVTDQLDIRSKTGNSPEVDNKVICLDQIQTSSDRRALNQSHTVTTPTRQMVPLPAPTTPKMVTPTSGTSRL